MYQWILGAKNLKTITIKQKTMENKKDKIGAWKKSLASGKEVISFTIEGKKYDMWVNGFKKEEKQPDYHITINDYKKAENKQEYAVNQQEHEEHKTDLPF